MEVAHEIRIHVAEASSEEAKDFVFLVDDPQNPKYTEEAALQKMQADYSMGDEEDFAYLQHFDCEIPDSIVKRIIASAP